MGFRDLSSEKFGVGVLFSVLYEQFSLDLLYSAKSLGREGAETRLFFFFFTVFMASPDKQSLALVSKCRSGLSPLEVRAFFFQWSSSSQAPGNLEAIPFCQMNLTTHLK